MVWIERARITGLTVIPETYVIVVSWDDGRTFVKNMEPLISYQKIFAPLQDKNVFQQASIIDDGRAIGWPGDIDFCADALWLQARADDKDEPAKKIGAAE